MPPRPTTASDPLTVVGAGALQRDRALLVRWQQGERAAGAELLDHYTGFVHQLLQRLGMHGADRDECWQELVLEVMQQLPDLPQRLRTSFAGYLAWQVRDLVRNRRRQLRRQQVLPANEPSLAADAAPRTAFWEAMHRCAEQLPPRERQVFELRFLGGADLGECATTIGSNANAIAQAVFRLVRRLRDCLQRSGFDHPGDHR